MWVCEKCGRSFEKAGQSHYCGEKPATIEDYIQMQDPAIREILERVYETIRTAIPEAEERISWSMPTFYRKGNLIHFAASKKHLGLYPGDQAVEHFAPKLEGFSFSKGSIRFPYRKEIPYDLIAEIAVWCDAQVK